MDHNALAAEIGRIFQAKAEFRKQSAALSYPEKVRIVVAMQKRRAPIVALRGKTQVVWEMPEAGGKK